MDGTTYFFGFDYGNDLVVSPLINDVDMMTRFASKYMLQRDGSHEDAYWRDLAGYDSELCSDIKSRTFTSQHLSMMASLLNYSMEHDASIPLFWLEYHLRYLLAAAGGWTADTDLEEAGEKIAIIRGEKPLAQGASFSDISRGVQSHVHSLIDSLPGNLATLFSALRS